jgi:hypothetical protein
MKIISPFKDYYDSVGNSWHTDEPLFKRMQVEKTIIECPKAFTVVQNLNDFKSGVRMPTPNYEFSRMIVFFCGRWYPYWKGWSFPKTIYCDTVEGIISYYEVELAKPACSRYLRQDGEGFVKNAKYNGWTNWDRHNMQLFLERDRTVPAEVFIEVGAPYFIMTRREREWVLTTNPILKEFFPRHFDAYSCFQEVSMYLGNQLAQPDIAPLTVGSDKVIAAQKGFDDMSFRTTAPGAKKLHREKNRLRKRGLMT